MPFIPTPLTSDEFTRANNLGLTGSKLLAQVDAVSRATCAYLLMRPLSVISFNACIGPGVGTYTGFIIGPVPNAMASMMYTRARNLRILGRDTLKLFNAISFGVCKTVNTTGISQGFVAGGGTGFGQGFIINLDVMTLQGLIRANYRQLKMSGTWTEKLIHSIAFGICNHLMTSAVVNTICIGIPIYGPFPVPGVGTGVLV